MSSPEALLWAASVLPEFDPGKAGAACPIPGGGSNRRLTRLHLSGPSLILAENPSPTGDEPNENDSFMYLSKHLGERGLPVPKVIAYDREKGFYLMEDLGDRDLWGEVASRTEGEGVEHVYRKAVDVLVTFQTEGTEGFEPGRCHSPPRYDRRLMIDWESGYFHREFVERHLRLPPPDSGAALEYGELANRAEEAGANFLLHRDFQSQNLKIHKGGIWIIDFQGARFGPPQYDLAALLLDPYVELPGPLRSGLMEYYLDTFCRQSGLQRTVFLDHYPHIAVHRLMQALGAFAFLGDSRKKTGFLRFIPAGVRLLEETFELLPGRDFPALQEVIAAIVNKVRLEAAQ